MTEANLIKMVSRINEHVVAFYNKIGLERKFSQEWIDKNKWAISEGRKYFKTTANGSVTAFIDKQTGDIYKPASFMAPAKGVRGNVNSEKNGEEALNYTPDSPLVFINYTR